MSTTLVVVTTEHTAAALDIQLSASWRSDFVVMHDLSTISDVLRDRDGPFFICLMFWHGNASLPVWFDGERYHAFEELLAPVRAQRARGERVYAYLRKWPAQRLGHGIRCVRRVHDDRILRAPVRHHSVDCAPHRDRNDRGRDGRFLQEREASTRASVGVWSREETPVELRQYTDATRSVFE